ncbi:MAG TPA: hypothetical protein VF178_05165 [Gemmatimonadaceae bacterium]
MWSHFMAADVEAPVLAIRINPAGDIECLHDDELALHELGTMEVRRASHVEWDGSQWVARDAETGEVIARDVLRSRCIAAEVAHFNRKIAEGFRLFATGAV